MKKRRLCFKDTKEIDFKKQNFFLRVSYLLILLMFARWGMFDIGYN